jgi:uncharacterized protein (DUF111 family)
MQRQLIFTRLILFIVYHNIFGPNRPSSGVQVVVMKESAGHCSAVLFPLCGCLGLLRVMWLTICINFGVLELHVFVLPVIHDVSY